MFLITIDQIKYFLAIYEFNSFSIASEELSISQSSISKHIKALEHELDTVLFNRTTRNMKLTEAGEEFLIHATKLMSEYNNTIHSMKKYSNKKDSILKIGAIPVISQYGIIALIARFKSKYPHINIEVIEGERDDVVNMLNKSEIDFAFLRDFNMCYEIYNIHPLITDELVLVTPKNHVFSNRKYISLDEAKNENFILLNSKSGMDKFIIEECNKYDFMPNITYSINKIETILGLVSEGFGVSLLMKEVISSFNKNSISVNLLKKPLTNSLSLIYNRNKKLSKNQIIFKEFIINSKKGACL